MPTCASIAVPSTVIVGLVSSRHISLDSCSLITAHVSLQVLILAVLSQPMIPYFSPGQLRLAGWHSLDDVRMKKSFQREKIRDEMTVLHRSTQRWQLLRH